MGRRVSWRFIASLVSPSHVGAVLLLSEIPNHTNHKMIHFAKKLVCGSWFITLQPTTNHGKLLFPWFMPISNPEPFWWKGTVKLPAWIQSAVCLKVLLPFSEWTALIVNTAFSKVCFAKPRRPEWHCSIHVLYTEVHFQSKCRDGTNRSLFFFCFLFLFLFCNYLCLVPYWTNKQNVCIETELSNWFFSVLCSVIQIHWR